MVRWGAGGRDDVDGVGEGAEGAVVVDEVGERVEGVVVALPVDGPEGIVGVEDGDVGVRGVPASAGAGTFTHPCAKCAHQWGTRDKCNGKNEYRGLSSGLREV
jgi:hypothetical protein